LYTSLFVLWQFRCRYSAVLRVRILLAILFGIDRLPSCEYVDTAGLRPYLACSEVSGFSIYPNDIYCPFGGQVGAVSRSGVCSQTNVTNLVDGYYNARVVGGVTF